MAIQWQINGVVLPRNPTNISLTHDPTNATYAKMADGSERRIVPPNLLSAAQVQIEWQFADARIQKAVMSLLNQAVLAANSKGAISKILLDGQMPAVELWAYLESPTVQYSGQRVKSGNANDLIIDTRPGQGGVRKDITLEGRTDGPYLHSHIAIPASLPTAQQVAQWWGGPSGNNVIDGLPTWNGNAWKQVASTSTTLTFSNLGTAPWSPTIQINGPFNSGFALTVKYQDVDGTGQGVVFTYTGPNVNPNDFLILDLQKLRLKASIAGAINEIYTFTVNTVANALPFPYWPPAPPGTFNVAVSVAGATASTTVDYSNNGTETFRYWA